MKGARRRGPGLGSSPWDEGFDDYDDDEDDEVASGRASKQHARVNLHRPSTAHPLREHPTVNMASSPSLMITAPATRPISAQKLGRSAVMSMSEKSRIFGRSLPRAQLDPPAAAVAAITTTPVTPTATASQSHVSGQLRPASAITRRAYPSYSLELGTAEGRAHHAPTSASSDATVAVAAAGPRRPVSSYSLAKNGANSTAEAKGSWFKSVGVVGFSPEQQATSVVTAFSEGDDNDSVAAVGSGLGTAQLERSTTKLTMVVHRSDRMIVRRPPVRAGDSPTHSSPSSIPSAAPTATTEATAMVDATASAPSSASSVLPVVDLGRSLLSDESLVLNRDLRRSKEHDAAIRTAMHSHQEREETAKRKRDLKVRTSRSNQCGLWTLRGES